MHDMFANVFFYVAAGGLMDLMLLYLNRSKI